MSLYLRMKLDSLKYCRMSSREEEVDTDGDGLVDALDDDDDGEHIGR